MDFWLEILFDHRLDQLILRQNVYELRFEIWTYLNCSCDMLFLDEIHDQNFYARQNAINDLVRTCVSQHVYSV